VGRRGLERALDGREPIDRAAGRERAVERVADLLATEAGRPLPSAIEREMASRFGHDFGEVRVHDGPAAARSAHDLDAAAYTVGSDVVFGEGFDPDRVDGRLLLAHELAHVVQSSRGVTPTRLVSRRGGPEERGTERAAARIVAGEQVTVGNAPDALVSRSALGWYMELAGDAVDVASDVAGGTEIGAQVTTARDLARELEPEAREAIDDAGTWVGETAGSVYDGMQQNARYVRQAEAWLSEGIDWAQNEAAIAGYDLAARLEGVPVLGGLATEAAGALDGSTQLLAGAAQGASGLVGGLAETGANPVDAVRGVATLVGHASMPGLPTPIEMGEGAHEVLFEGGDLAEVAARVFDPARSREADAEFWEQMVQALVEPYHRSGKDGDYLQMIGRIGFDAFGLVSGSQPSTRGTNTGGRMAGPPIRRTADDLASTGLDDATDATSVVDDAARAPTVPAAVAESLPGTEGGAVSTWIVHEGKRIRPTPSGWRDETGQFVRAPYSPAGGPGTGESRSAFLRRLKRQSLADPDRLPSHIVGWLRNQRRQRGSGYLKNPPGYQGGHPWNEPFVTHGNEGRGAWEFFVDNNARSEIAKRQVRLANDPTYTVSDLLREVRAHYRRERSDPNSRPNLPR
jgi:hypothetical protein